MLYTIIKRLSATSLFIFLGELAAFCKVNFIIGSNASFFSLNQCCAPLLGRYSGSASLILWYAIKTFFKLIYVGKLLSISLLAYHIPTFCGGVALSWLAPYQQKTTTLKRIGVAIIVSSCIAAFVAHPIGRDAALYTLLWLIPLIVAAKAPRNLFAASLASTITTHAVGSVIWLYTHPTTATFWVGLIPVAIAERLLLALCLVGCMKLYEAIKTIKITDQIAQPVASL